MSEQVSILSAKPGDLVKYNTPEFDVLNDGQIKRLRRTVVITKGVAFSKEEAIARRNALQEELHLINAMLEEMDKHGL